MKYVVLWLWFVGAVQMREEAKDNTSTRPDPAGWFYSEELRDFHDAHPKLHKYMYVVAQVSVVVAWPVFVTLSILRLLWVEYLKWRSAS